MRKGILQALDDQASLLVKPERWDGSKSPFGADLRTAMGIEWGGLVVFTGTRGTST